MSNIINNLLLNESPVSTTTTTGEQVTKETPSLFDSLLSTATSSKEILTSDKSSVAVKNVEVNNINVENTKIEIPKDIDVTKVSEQSQEEIVVGNDKEVASNSTTSLLDKLIIEAKKDIGKENLLTNTINPSSSLNSSSENIIPNVSTENNELLNTVVETSDLNTEVKIGNIEAPKIETPKETLVDNKEDVKVDTTIDTTELNKIVEENTTDENQKVVNNTTNSLLDKLVIEAKKDLNKTNSKDTLLNKIVDSTVASETPKIETPKETLVDNKEDVKVDTTIDTTELNKIVEENTTDENQKVVNNTTNSLLDKLVIEAKKDLNKTNSKDTLLNKIVDSTVASETPKIETPKETVVDNKEDVKVDTTIDTTELNKIVEENTTDENQKVVNNTTNSLLDKLVIEAKKDLNKTNSKDTLLNKIVDSTVASETPKVETVKEAVVDNKEDVKVDLKIDSSQVTVDTIVPVENEVVSEVETVSIVENEQVSLMDKLIQKTTEKIVSIDTNNIATETSTQKVVTEDLITNIYLGSQKNQLSNQSLFNKKEAVTLLKEGTNVQAIKVSAEMLDLGLENIDIQQTKDDKLDIKKTTIDIVDRKNMIDNILSQKNVKSEEIKNLITQSVEASKALLKDEIHFAEDSVVNVNSPLSYNIQSKIIGAKQQMATVMSDIARQMYENYKPPVTAFRINLNPTELGSIAILMKSDKNSGLSISLNASNSVTLDTLMENQNVLKNSLNKTFSENTKFNLDFSSSNENNNNQSSSNQDNQQNNRRFEQQIDTQSILQLQEENKNIEEKILDYM